MILTGVNRNDVTQLLPLPLLHSIPMIRGKPGRPRRRPEVVLADRGYDHDIYRRRLRARGITPRIARRGIAHGSGLGRHRWVVERGFAWLRRFVAYAATKRAISEALNRDSEMFRSCRAAMYAAGEPLLARAQKAGEARSDIGFDDLLRMVTGITSAAFIDDEQRERVLGVALDGVRIR